MQYKSLSKKYYVLHKNNVKELQILKNSAMYGGNFFQCFYLSNVKVHGVQLLCLLLDLRGFLL